MTAESEPMSGRPYSTGIWLAKPGQEDDLIAGWNDLRKWSQDKWPSARAPRFALLRDRERPNRFFGLAAWDDDQQFQAFRSDDGFEDRVARLRAVTESVELLTLDAVIDSDDG